MRRGIVASWVVSPVTGGIIAALFLYSLKKTIFFKSEPGEAADDRRIRGASPTVT